MFRYGDPVGPLATIRREPGQARKGAAEAVDVCAGGLLVGPPPDFPLLVPDLRFSFCCFVIHFTSGRHLALLALIPVYSVFGMLSVGHGAVARTQ